MKRFRELTNGTAGFYNTVGFNDDTRAFLSIPEGRHGAAHGLRFPRETGRRASVGRDEAFEVAQDLAYRLVKKAYRL